MAKKSLEGMRFGRLTVVAEGGRSKSRQIMWICQCDCGSMTHPINGDVLRRGKSRSCGCLQREEASVSRSTHRRSKSRPYNIWSGLKNRCLNTNHPHYKDYGGRGIGVCDEWMHDFQAFYEWAMANGYRDDLTIDRIDNNGNYEPSNCRWTTMAVQRKNQRPRRKLNGN